MKNTEMFIIGGLALVAGAFIFKDQICPTIPIPFICGDRGGMPDPIKKVVDNCAKTCPGGPINQGCMKKCTLDSMGVDENGNPVESNYAGYY